MCIVSMLGVGVGGGRGPVAEEPSRREKEQVANTCFEKIT